MTDSTSSSPLVTVGRILLGFVPLIVLVGVVEGGLRWAGLGDEPIHVSTSRGFDPAADYLVEDPEVPGGWRTHVQDEPDRELTIPPKSDAVRVLLMGGSNTQLLPEYVLQDALNEGAEQSGSDRRWEVLNLGRAGYGSERVLIYLNQAMKLEPDLVVIYSGHNEFVEAGFADELGLGTGGAGISWKERVASHLRVLRSYRVLAEAFTGSRAASSAWADGGDGGGLTAPEPWAPAVRSEFSLNEAETQRYYDAYEQNIISMCDVVTSTGTPVLICTPVGNLLVPPTQVWLQDWMTHIGLTGPEKTKLAGGLKAVQAMVPERFAELIVKPSHLRVFTWYNARKDDLHEVPFTPPSLRPLSPPFAESPGMTGDRKHASVEGAHWPDPADWDSLTRDRLSAIGRLMERQLTAAERTSLQQCADGYRQAVELSQRSPRIVFSYALVLWLLGDDDAEAVRLLQETRDRDVAPRAANTHIHEAIRRVASETSGVTLFDSAELFAAANQDGLVGYEMMMDVCHLQPGARVVLMHLLADALPPLVQD